MIRVATWNQKQEVTPKQSVARCWQWLEESVVPTVAVLTETKVPAQGVP